jgi:hypothetical protein
MKHRTDLQSPYNGPSNRRRWVATRSPKSGDFWDGGKVLFRHKSQLDQPTSDAVQLDKISAVQIVSKISLYGYFYKLTLDEQRSIASINVDDTPVTSFVTELGLKMVMISGRQGAWAFDEEKQTYKATSTAEEFRMEAQHQQMAFRATCMKGANALTPGIVHADILPNEVALKFLRSRCFARMDASTSQTCENLKSALTQNPSFRMGLLFMDFIGESKQIADVLHVKKDHVFQSNLLNWYRWALLRIASTTGIFHNDFHWGNALYSTEASGFHHDIDEKGGLVPVKGSIQIIDWGRTFENAALRKKVRQLMVEMDAYNDETHPDWFVPNFTYAKEKYIRQSKMDPKTASFNKRISEIFTEWLQLGGCSAYDQYSWVIRSPEIDSHTMMFYGVRYLRNRRIVKKDAKIYAEVLFDDTAIMTTIANLQ